MKNFEEHTITNVRNVTIWKIQKKPKRNIRF